MSINPQETLAPPPEAPKNDKELNFRKQQQMYEKMLEEKDRRLAEVEQKLASRRDPNDDDDDDSDPYVDKRKLAKTLNKFGEQSKQQTKSDIDHAVQKALAEERKQNWLKQNPDFQEVLQHAQKFAEKDPELAETILEMPDGFERQKLVYRNIKSMGLHKPEEKPSTIQNTIDKNRRSPFYQPTGVGSAPYASAADFSPSGQKNAYDKLQEFKRNMRL